MENQTTQPKKEKKWSLILGWIILFVIIIGIVAIGGEKREVGPAQVSQPTKEKVPLSIDRSHQYAFTTDDKFIVNGTTSPEAKVIVNGKEIEVNEQGGFSTIIPLEFGENFIKIVAKIDKDENNASVGIERITQEEKDRRKAEWEKETKESLEKSILEITAEEIYSYYVMYQTDSSIEDLVRERYDGKIVEVTGIVYRTVDYYKDTIAAKRRVDVSKFIEENKRYEICLADNQGHACVAWIYSPSFQLISGIKKGDKITVVGRWRWAYGIEPDLMNSGVKKIY